MTNQKIADLFLMTPQGIAKWRKEKRPIISLLERYYEKEDIEEFLETGKIKKFENIENNNYLEERCLKLYRNILRSFRKTSINLIVEFILELNNNEECITIEKLAQFIFSSDDSNFKQKSIEDIELAKYEQMVECGEIKESDNPYPSSSDIKLSVLNKFQKLDSIIFDYFCSHINVIIELNDKRPKMKNWEF